MPGDDPCTALAERIAIIMEACGVDAVTAASMERRQAEVSRRRHGVKSDQPAATKASAK